MPVWYSSFGRGLKVHRIVRAVMLASVCTTAAVAQTSMDPTDPAYLSILPFSKFDLVINMKTAKALGLASPSSLLARADEIIQ